MQESIQGVSLYRVLRNRTDGYKECETSKVVYPLQYFLGTLGFTLRRVDVKMTESKAATRTEVT